MQSTPGEWEILDVYRKTIGPLYSAVSRRCGGERALAEDIVQETWLRAVDSWRRQGIPDVPAAWLATVARNLLANHFRRRRMVPLDGLPDEPPAPPAVADEASEIAAVIARGLAGLPPAEAGLLRAFHLQERPVAGIAKDMQISERAVEGRLRRARRKLGAA